MPRSELVDVEVHLHVRTPKAVRVSLDGNDANAEWVPLSQCEIEQISSAKNRHELTLPEWLAKERGFI